MRLQRRLTELFLGLGTGQLYRLLLFLMLLVAVVILGNVLKQWGRLRVFVIRLDSSRQQTQAQESQVVKEVMHRVSCSFGAYLSAVGYQMRPQVMPQRGARGVPDQLDSGFVTSNDNAAHCDISVLGRND